MIKAQPETVLLTRTEVSRFSDSAVTRTSASGSPRLTTRWQMLSEFDSGWRRRDEIWTPIEVPATRRMIGDRWTAPSPCSQFKRSRLRTWNSARDNCTGGIYQPFCQIGNLRKIPTSGTTVSIYHRYKTIG